MTSDRKWILSLCLLMVCCMLAFGVYIVFSGGSHSPKPDDTSAETSGPIETEQDSGMISDESESEPLLSPITNPVDTAEVTDATGSETNAPVTDPPVTSPPVTDPLPTVEDWNEFKNVNIVKDWYATPTNSPIPSEKDPAYTEVVKRNGAVEHRVYNDFFRAGIPATVVYEKSDVQAYGRVLRVEIDGYEDDSCYYVKIGSSAVIHVSAGTGYENVAAHQDKILFLTFDDGPCAYTNEVLAILAQYNVKATFFTVGTSVSAYSYQIPAVVKQGHALGCHSETHTFPDMYATTGAFQKELIGWANRVNQVLGGIPSYRLFRFPGGSNTGNIKGGMLNDFREILQELNFNAYDWNCANSDAWDGMRQEDESKQEYLQRMLRTTLGWVEAESEYRICLMHETNTATRETLAWAIEYIMDQGYCFRTLDMLSDDQLF